MSAISRLPVYIDGFEIDAFVNESHEYDSIITDHPVEDGSDISDHIIDAPLTLTVEGIVSDTPVGPLADRRAAEFTSSAAYSNIARAFLTQLKAERRLVTVTTDLGDYTNMVLKTVSFPRDDSSGDALRFRAVFREFVIVANERTTINVAVPRAKKQVDKGTKPTGKPEVSAADAQAAINRFASTIKPRKSLGRRSAQSAADFVAR